ncbi:tyrosinase family oxidase copper chaperone [Streptomyces odonnellii]|uniref:tyrosinase family oxidase copper chaperone n=1 Tax=Streptomyces odonnellii TaxID=1417980 RepID=UPI00099CCB94|nr:tyrosinase family oxidase copper chaperone [Streptomyces odonnellii]
MVSGTQTERRSVQVRRPEAEPDRTEEPPAPGRAPTGRRRLLRAMFTLGVVSGTSAVLAPVVRAGQASEGAAAGTVEEIYRGRHIRIGATATAPGASGAHGAPSGSTAPEVRIDGRPLQLMRRADGSYMSIVNHYDSFPTPLAAARAAVDELAGAQLSFPGPTHHL